MKSLLTRSAIVVSVIALSACGGGSSGSSRVETPSKPKPPKPTASYNTLLGELVGLGREYGIADGSSTLTKINNMPVSGTATYNGVGGYRPDSAPSGESAPLLGRATMKADFRAGKLTGKVRDFKAAPGHTTTGGALDVSANIKENYSTGRITGNLNLDGQNRKIEDRAIGVFYGDNANALGVVSGKNVTPFARHTIAIIAEK